MDTLDVLATVPTELLQGVGRICGLPDQGCVDHRETSNDDRRNHESKLAPSAPTFKSTVSMLTTSDSAVPGPAAVSLVRQLPTHPVCAPG